MAHGLKRQEQPKIHQVLHGYADGHRQLVASIKLKPRDIKTMLLLSDISGPGARVDETGYLTGYPLLESGVYALARTWSAPEMPRPGCVWTQTILIDFSDLATLPSLANLVTLFQRPHSLLFEDYGNVLTLGDDSIDVTLPDNAREWSRQVLAGLYGKPRSRITATRPVGVDIEKSLLAIWSQQWPRLRRAFRFCTLSAADRSTEGNNFDLQLLPSTDRSLRTRFPNAVEAENIENSEGSWLDDTISDLLRPDVCGLRSFIREIGADVATGRETFRSLCQLHQLVGRFKSRPDALNEAIALLQNELGTEQARAARTMVASAALAQSIEFDDAALDFLLQHLELVDSETLQKGTVRIGRAVWARDPNRLVTLSGTGGVLGTLPQRTFEALSITELFDGLRRAPALMHVALGHRPEIVTEPSFWSGEAIDIDEAFAVIASSQELCLPALAALISAQRDDLAIRTARAFGALRILEAVESAFNQESDHRYYKKWIAASVSDPEAVAMYLSSSSSKFRALLVAIAQVMPPDAAPNISGIDPWLIASRGAIGLVEEEALLYLNAYFLSRALGSQSCNAAELAKLGFDSTHSAASASRLPIEAWRLLESRLPWSFLWFDWDPCQRIRNGVANLFVSRELSPLVFGYVTADDDLFELLVDAVTRDKQGKLYLKQVLHAMSHDSKNVFGVRIQSIQKLLH
ncbi:GAP1-N1 domain-containing protein [Collimonas humicola]|uniref:GAP1-N1 domain-containing protein n=1 Tax=Collimonas humicola TaxID=2825886 RepID=UPI001B8BDA4C|nr:hypothetical protein [Collimonas humicola]